MAETFTLETSLDQGAVLGEAETDLGKETTVGDEAEDFLRGLGNNAAAAYDAEQGAPESENTEPFNSFVQLN